MVLSIAKSKNIVIQNLKFKNAPNVFQAGTLREHTDTDIGTSTYVTSNGASIIINDNYVAFKPGCNYATVTNITCTGSHGLCSLRALH
ncbi:hypothetical protein VTI74DRAFT_1370 [Chaetomium olivicolor]